MAETLTWNEVRAACTALADGAFLATTQSDGRPHLAWVGVGFTDEPLLWTATYASSQKAKNLRFEQRVALHWPERRDRLIFMRATARLVDEDRERARLWEAGVLPYDQDQFFGSPANPELLFVELTPTSVSIHDGDPTNPPARWTPS